MFTEPLHKLLDYINNLPGFENLVGNMNIHFDNPLQSPTKHTLTTLSLCILFQVINKPTHKSGNINDYAAVQPDDDIHKNFADIDSLDADHYYIKSYFNVSVSKPSTLYKTNRDMDSSDRPSFISELSWVSEFSSDEKANDFCEYLCTAPDEHAPPPLRKVITHNSNFNACAHS